MHGEDESSIRYTSYFVISYTYYIQKCHLTYGTFSEWKVIGHQRNVMGNKNRSSPSFDEGKRDPSIQHIFVWIHSDDEGCVSSCLTKLSSDDDGVQTWFWSRKIITTKRDHPSSTSGDYPALFVGRHSVGLLIKIFLILKCLSTFLLLLNGNVKDKSSIWKFVL